MIAPQHGSQLQNKCSRAQNLVKPYYQVFAKSSTRANTRMAKSELETGRDAKNNVEALRPESRSLDRHRSASRIPFKADTDLLALSNIRLQSARAAVEALASCRSWQQWELNFEASPRGIQRAAVTTSTRTHGSIFYMISV